MVRFLGGLILAALMVAIERPSFAQFGTAFTYQGSLDDGGAPATGGYDMRFTLWDSPAGGAQLGAIIEYDVSGAGTIAVTDGLFSVPLDFGAEIFDGDPRWLEIEVRNEDPLDAAPYTPLAPRVELRPVPYAIRADSAATADNVDDADADPANELNSTLALNGTTLQLTDAGGMLSADLSGLINDSDWAYSSGSGLTGNIYHSGDIALGSFTDPAGHGLNAQNYAAGKAAVRGTDQDGPFLYAEGMLGVLLPGFAGWPGVPVDNAGVFGIKPNGGNNGAAVMGWSNGSNADNYAGLFRADGPGGTNYALHAEALNGGTNWAGYFVGNVHASGNVGIGTTTPAARLHVVDGPSLNQVEISSGDGIGTWLNLGNTTPGGRQFGIISTGDGNTEGAGALLFRDNSVAAVRMMIDDAGNVGIGTLDPTLPLHVIGNGAVTGNLGVGTTTPTLPLHVIGNGAVTGNFGVGTTAPTFPLHVVGNTRLSGLTRMGSETGNSELPDFNFPGFAGLISRRIISTNSAAGQVIARTEFLRLERDGTQGGWRLAWSAGLGQNNVAYGWGLTSAGAMVPIHVFVGSPAAAGTQVVVTDAQNIVRLDLWFGQVYNARGHTRVDIARTPGDHWWNGDLTSTFNQ